MMNSLTSLCSMLKRYGSLVWVLCLLFQMVLPLIGVYYIGTWELTYVLTPAGSRGPGLQIGPHLSGFIPWFKLAALVGNVTLCGFFYRILVKMRMNLSERGFGLAIILLFCSAMCFILGIVTLNSDCLTPHLTVIVLGALCYALLDLCLVLSVNKHSPEWEMSKAEYTQFFLFLDVPNIIAFSMIYSLLLDKANVIHGLDESGRGFYFFVSGVIAFQWLASNVLFVVLMLHNGKDCFALWFKRILQDLAGWLEGKLLCSSVPKAPPTEAQE